MKIQWLGHSAFLVTHEGKRVIIDPYESGSYSGAINYKPIRVEADYVLTTTPGRPDHAFTQDIKGTPKVIAEAGTYRINGLKIFGEPDFSDRSGDAVQGKVTVFVLDFGDYRVCHLGNLGHLLTDEKVKRIGRVDILMVPVGGFFTLGVPEVEDVVAKLKPKLIFPMHVQNEACLFQIDPVDRFLLGKKNVRVLASSEYVVNGLPENPEIVILKHAL